MSKSCSKVYEVDVFLLLYITQPALLHDLVYDSDLPQAYESLTVQWKRSQVDGVLQRSSSMRISTIQLHKLSAILQPL